MPSRDLRHGWTCFSPAGTRGRSRASCSWRLPSSEMIPGVRGLLITATFARTLDTLPVAVEPSDTIVRALDVWAERRESEHGPATPLRALTDAIVIPLLRILAFDVAGRADGEKRSVLAA